MTELAVRSENLLAAIGRGRLVGSASAGCARPGPFLRRRRTYPTIEAVAVGLMTDLAVRSESLLAAIGRGKLLGSASAGCARPAAFLRGRRTYHRIEAVAAETPGITSEVGTPKKDSDSVDRDEPDRQWF